MKFRGYLASLFLLLGSTSGFSIQKFAPENTLHLQDYPNARTNVTESDFNAVIDNALDIYRPIFQAQGLTFDIERNWEDSTVNAYAYREGDRALVAMFGGLARRPEVTVNGFIMVVCHEIGHHLGGYPFYDVNEGGWASNEGNSDYFAAMACGRKLIKSYIPVTQEKTAENWCRQMWGSDAQTCINISQASQSTANLLATIGGSRIPRASTPDRTVVNKTSNDHPNAQCRLDTMLAADLCKKSWNDAIIPKNANATCQRPRCWFLR